MKKFQKFFRLVLTAYFVVTQGKLKEEKIMNTTQPIRNQRELEMLKDYYRKVIPNQRNYLLIILGLNTALRISDILNLTWNHVYDFSNRRFRRHIVLVEQKTGKRTSIFINQELKQALTEYGREQSGKKKISGDSYLFIGKNGENKPISRVQAYRIIKEVSTRCHFSGDVSCHSLRKTFGYYAWKQGVSPALLMNIYNHSSFQVTRRYLGIEQEDRDEVFRSIRL